MSNTRRDHNDCVHADICNNECKAVGAERHGVVMIDIFRSGYIRCDNYKKTSDNNRKN